MTGWLNTRKMGEKERGQGLMMKPQRLELTWRVTTTLNDSPIGTRSSSTKSKTTSCASNWFGERKKRLARADDPTAVYRLIRSSVVPIHREITLFTVYIWSIDKWAGHSRVAWMIFSRPIVVFDCSSHRFHICDSFVVWISCGTEEVTHPLTTCRCWLCRQCPIGRMHRTRMVSLSRSGGRC